MHHDAAGLAAFGPLLAAVHFQQTVLKPGTRSTTRSAPATPSATATCNWPRRSATPGCLARPRYEAGLTDLLVQLDAEPTLLQALPAPPVAVSQAAGRSQGLV